MKKQARTLKTTMTARTIFIEKTVAAYRARAAAEGIREVSGDEWARLMQARMQAQYGTENK